MLVLLPPSEGKEAPRRGKPLDPAALAYAEALAVPRAAVLDAAGPALREAPTAAAMKVYTGVLFQALRLPDLPGPARRRVLIFSGLWGVVRPGDRIPGYKLPGRRRSSRSRPARRPLARPVARRAPRPGARRRPALGPLRDDVVTAPGDGRDRPRVHAPTAR